MVPKSGQTGDCMQVAIAMVSKSFCPLGFHIADVTRHFRNDMRCAWKVIHVKEE